jgi:dimethylargininase
MFTKAIVRLPGENIINGLSSSDLGIPDYDKAVLQHSKYIKALIECGLEVHVLEPEEKYPDAVFIEDVSLLTPECAIITRPGAPERRGETEIMYDVLKSYYSNIEMIESPGTVEAGDILMAGSHYYIGLSERTNISGAEQIIAFLNKYGLTGSTLEVGNTLHLKSNLAYIENNNMVISEAYANLPEFQKYNLIIVDKEEASASNCVWINGNVLVREGYPKLSSLIEALSYKTIKIDNSEFRKIDGGLSCLSLRF